MIDIAGLQKSFAARDAGQGFGAVVLKNVSLKVERGEIFGIIGRSGAGKSTLVRCINLLERPDHGRVMVDGQDITALRGAELRAARRRIGMIFQHFNLLSSRSVFDNVALPLELAGRSRDFIDREVTPLLELVGLSDKLHSYPAQLSGGQKQRVAIARALASKPAVLLCDEATSALDPETTQSILALLKDINRKLALTILLITHEMPVIRAICDKVAVLERGVMVEQGPVFDIFTAPKADVTRSLVHDLIDRDLPEWLVERMAAFPGGTGNRILRITFYGPSADRPIIAELVRRFDLVVNILQANVDYIQGQPFGIIIVEAIGAQAAVDDAIAFVRDHHLRAEVLGHVAGDDRAVA
jgi:D-methionine transport system ATP-binding protein